MALLPAAAFAEPLVYFWWPVFLIGSFILSFLLFFCSFLQVVAPNFLPNSRCRITNS
jgi:hypothetical protein